VNGAQIASRRVLAVGGLALVTIGLLLAAVVGVLDPASHVAVLDELAVPGSWDLAHTEIVKSLLLGSRVERYYVVDADPDEVVDPATRMLAAAGFTVEVVTAPRDWCDNRPLQATPEIICPTKVIPPCWTNGQGGPMTCNLTARRGEDRLSIAALDRGERATYFVGSESHFVGVPDRIVVRLTVNY
jgi:hypothetical protein